MALIGDYQHGPQLAAQAPAGDATEGGTEGGAAGDATFGSRTALSAPRGPVLRRWLARRRAAALPGRPAAAPRRPGSPAGLARKRRRGTVLGLAGRTGAAAALVAVGALIAVALDGGIGEPAPSASHNPATLPLVPAGPPPSSLAPLSGTRPGIEMLQPVGDGVTGFVVHGAGWPPRSTVTLTLAGRGAPSRCRSTAREPSTTRSTRGMCSTPGRSPWAVTRSWSPERAGAGSAPPSGSCRPRRHRVPPPRRAWPDRRHGAAGVPGAVSRPWTTTGPPGGSTTPGRSACPGPPR